jgi:tryptophan halogenase
MNTTSKVVILGGGTAGWLTGLFIQRNWPKIDVTIIEDPNRPPIIAGESGSTTFTSLLKHLRIDITDFVRKVNATPKLGGKFTDWNGVGTQFIHSLQTDYAPYLNGWSDYLTEHRDELTVGNLMSLMSAESAKDRFMRTILANNIPAAEGYFANYFIEENKVPFGAEADIPCIPMWHFESRGAAAYFKELGLARGITLLEGEFQNAQQSAGGDVTSITLTNQKIAEGNWFFDCSGFSRLLLGKTMEEPIVDATNHFPARAVVAWWDEPCPCVTTNATAMKYGWSWNINIRNRSGNGYLYDPDHISLDQAIQEAEIRFDKKITPIANFQFTPGMMRKAWKNNVIAIGLSSGFLEPLEANGVAIIVESLFGLQDYWDPYTPKFEEKTINRFNDRIWFIAEDIKDFLALHYRGKRRDTEFWQSHANDKWRIPSGLEEKLARWDEYYNRAGIEPNGVTYSPGAWQMVLQGLQLFDLANLAAMNEKFLPLGEKVLNINKGKYKALVEPFWTIEEWLKRTA